MKQILKDKKLTLFLDGKISSNNAREWEDKIQKELQVEYDQLVLNLRDLVYISSAGLRIILRLVKKNPTLRCIELSSDVYDIFDMTGFTSLVSTEKAYRQLSIDGCECIGRGAKGDVYKLNEEQIVKVYKDPDSLDIIFREKDLSKTAFVLGIPTPMSFDVVKVGDLYGTVFEMLNAQSFANYLIKHEDEFDSIIQKSVDILKNMHDSFAQAGNFPAIKKSYVKKLKEIESFLPIEINKKLSRMMDEIPEPLSVVHGDFHLKNIMMEGDEAMLIDMDTLSTGYPLFEFIPIYTAYVGHGELDPSIIEKYMGLPYEMTKKVCEKTLDKYFENKKEDAYPKIQLLSYIRLLDREVRNAKREAYLEYYTKKVVTLSECLETFLVDSLK